MIQTGLIQNAHSDLVTDVAYDFYGIRLATCSLDQRIKVWALDQQSGTWSVEDDWKAHDAAVSKLSWAHPEFGSLIASSSFDRTVRVWEQTSPSQTPDPKASANGIQPSTGRWVERALLTDARGTVRGVEFAPHHFGLKLASVASDNYVRIYECLEQPGVSSWQLTEEIDLQTSVSSGGQSRAPNTHALATPTQAHAPLDGPTPSLVAQALQQTPSSGPSRSMQNREADGGWCISWCKDRYWGEMFAAGCGTSGTVKIIQIPPSRKPITVAVLDPAPPVDEEAPAAPRPAPSAVTSVSWAPSCGRSYHLVATGGRDGFVRIWKLIPTPEDAMDMDDAEESVGWRVFMVGEFDHHKFYVSLLTWVLYRTVLSSVGHDGRVRLWKATTTGNVWRPAGSIGVEQNEEQDDKDIDMDS
ncbi:WD40 repeat-like protein [Fistulina hepatica ATCC 64428]|uniref:WD40 repeat-like protein n=1 Tax=Fistulina hepatica ATCC 64428 TaxID=1128425 RepID=A0A0D7AA88_9AGAR|nr:WD40 repeat-like protein [Fistulina hepatica ATCC 64428]